MGISARNSSDSRVGGRMNTIHYNIQRVGQNGRCTRLTSFGQDSATRYAENQYKQATRLLNSHIGKEVNEPGTYVVTLVYSDYSCHINLFKVAEPTVALAIDQTASFA